VLATLGRIGPALDTVVRKRLGISEPRSGEEWVALLHAISADLARFERRHRTLLESLVEDQWKPIQVGRVYDMVAGPTGRKHGYETTRFNVMTTSNESLTYRRELTRVPALPPAPIPSTPVYFIPGCYLGNVLPQDAGLPASCDLSRAIRLK
jgi:hypothetical protein